jgi:hypothetical protein
MLRNIIFLVLLTISFARRNPFHSMVKTNKRHIKNLTLESKKVLEICKMYPEKSINPYYYSYNTNNNNVCPNTKCRIAFESLNSKKNKFINKQNNDLIAFIVVIGFFIMIGLICR